MHGNTGLANAAQTVAKIGTRIDVSYAVSDSLGATGDAVGDETFTAGVINVTDFNVVRADGAAYTNNTGALNIAISVGDEDYISLDTALATAVLTAGNDVTDVVFGENSSISTWGAGATYPVEVKVQDNAQGATAANAWPTGTTEGNIDIKEIEFIAGGLTGIDLKRPNASSVEVYSYSKNATVGQVGYAPLGTRAGVNDATDFGVIDYTVTGAASLLAAYDVLDDGDTTTAEVVRITFDEPLHVNETVIGAADGLIGSTVNHYSIKIHQYRTDGINTDVISNGPVAYDNADFYAEVGANATDSIPLEGMKHIAYVETGTGTTDTSVVYFLLQSKTYYTSTETIAVNVGGTTVTGAVGTTFTTDFAAGDVISIYDDVLKATSSYTITTVDSDTQLTVVPSATHTAAIVASADNTMAKSVVHIAQGNHFEVKFADYTTDTTLNATDDEFKILCDQFGNAINAAQNNFTQGNSDISW
jgi:hypothetical protein